MSSRDRTSPRRDSYRQHVHRPLNCLAFILPLLAFFHVGSYYYGSALFAPRDIGRVLRYFGATAAYLPAMLVILVLICQHAFRRDRWQVQPKVLAGMLGESIIAAVPLIILCLVSGRFIAQAAGSPQATGHVLQAILRSVGAGLYEEFIFRLVLISLFVVVFVDIFELQREPVLLAAVFVSALSFSLYHFSLNQLVNFPSLPWDLLIFRAIAGVYLGSLFVLRGLGVAVGAHVLFDIYSNVVVGY